ncbi:hypothetical protein [Draconibacterium mangrovi]|uniref:hypothetical protein n=1 Tax=Draconibacterium mangrovi TaxID=2697469 RepID=UPI0013D5ADEF|nr:hypothetical protein [Draconibacterium mangrovi]
MAPYTNTVNMNSLSPYFDNHPMESGTQYYACLILGDNEAGMQSDIVATKV